ncbi:hypothetical protein JZC05_004221 [Salmonella enterica subsp. enterica serovar Oranienburg]|nr:hypothetical protein [Salmonella enterica subsp. enterica serovar Oranienburg]EHE7835209.1 hypothetical protein [Salmonella enterica subsp. enterica serovar Oranienburg]
MKKSLIALAVVASTVVFGSSMAANTVTPGAWIPNGTVGVVELSGTLTPQDKVTPWEISTGAPVTNLDGFVQKGQQNVSVHVTNAIPVLGIRTQLKEAFQGQPGIAPQIDFKGAIDAQNFSGGRTTLTLDVKNVQAQKIGHLKVPFFAGAEYSFKGDGSSGKLFMSGDKAGDAFYGGLGMNRQSVGGIGKNDIESRIRSLNPQYLANFNDQGASYNGNAPTSNNFADTKYSFSAYYGAGIEAGNKIKIILDTPAASEAIVWRASLPIAVSYQ